MTRAIALTLAFLFVGLRGFAQEPAPLDPEPRITYKYGLNMRFGVSVLKDQTGKPVTKRLTYSDDGKSNTTVVRIDGKDSEFGGPQGKWIEKEAKLPLWSHQ